MYLCFLNLCSRCFPLRRIQEQENSNSLKSPTGFFTVKTNFSGLWLVKLQCRPFFSLHTYFFFQSEPFLTKYNKKVESHTKKGKVMNIIKNWLFNSGQSIRNINLSRKHADVSRGAFRVKTCISCKRVQGVQKCMRHLL